MCAYGNNLSVYDNASAHRHREREGVAWKQTAYLQKHNWENYNTGEFRKLYMK